jgi:hypothetical protein
VMSPMDRSTLSSFPSRASSSMVSPEDGEPSSSVVHDGRTTPETSLGMVSMAWQPNRRPQRPSTPSAILRAALSNVDSMRLPTWIGTPSSSEAAPPSVMTCGGVRRETTELGSGTDWAVNLGFFVGNPIEWVFEIFTVVICK